MKYRPITEIIISLLYIPETLRPFGRFKTVHSRIETGGLSLPLYPAMFTPEVYTISGFAYLDQDYMPLKREIILLSTIQNLNYFRDPIHIRYDKIAKGLPIC